MACRRAGWSLVSLVGFARYSIGGTDGALALLQQGEQINHQRWG